MSEIQLQTMLADYAQVAEGKLNVIGAGWSHCGPAPTPSALAFIASVPWDLANQRYALAAELVDEDYVPFRPEDAPEDFKFRFEVPLEVGRPPGITAGSSLDWVQAVNIGPLPLEPGKRYVWVITLNGETKEGWSHPFNVRPADFGGIRLVG